MPYVRARAHVCLAGTLPLKADTTRLAVSFNPICIQHRRRGEIEIEIEIAAPSDARPTRDCILLDAPPFTMVFGIEENHRYNRREDGEFLLRLSIRLISFFIFFIEELMRNRVRARNCTFYGKLCAGNEITAPCITIFFSFPPFLPPLLRFLPNSRARARLCLLRRKL